MKPQTLIKNTSLYRRLLKEELNAIINENIIFKPSPSNKKWRIIYLNESKIYAKLIHKSALFDTYKFDSDIDCKKILTNFYKSNNYSFVPEFLFETENYFCFKYYNDYTPLLLNDVINTNILKIQEILGVKLDQSKLETTSFFKNIISSFNTLYKNEIILSNVPESIRSDFNFTSTSSFLNYVCITPSNIALQDFLVRRNNEGEIIDWKYVHIDNWDIFIPNYIINLNTIENDLFDDTLENFEKINSLNKKPSVFLIYDSKYYDADLIQNIL
jgi:hypothetical protein